MGFYLAESMTLQQFNTDKVCGKPEKDSESNFCKGKRFGKGQKQTKLPKKIWLSICQYSNLSRSASSSICFASAKYVCSKCLNISATFGYLFLKSLDNFPK